MLFQANFLYCCYLIFVLSALDFFSEFELHLCNYGVTFTYLVFRNKYSVFCSMVPFQRSDYNIDYLTVIFVFAFARE